MCTMRDVNTLDSVNKLCNKKKEKKTAAVRHRLFKFPFPDCRLNHLLIEKKAIDKLSDRKSAMENAKLINEKIASHIERNNALLLFFFCRQFSFRFHTLDVAAIEVNLK